MTTSKLVEQIKQKNSLLCVGLDTDISKIPKHLLSTDDPMFEFNKAIIVSTSSYAIAFKINTAFYESKGIKGWISMEKTIRFLNEHYPSIFTIADAKRGDIGNTSDMYAKAFFEHLNFDAITLSPYMGKDSISPFLKYKEKTSILLGLTSNIGASDFQLKSTGKDCLYEEVIKTSQKWNHKERLMYVVGATQADYIRRIRQLIPKAFLLIPGIGSQGGSIQEVCKHGLNSDYGLIINSSRGIIYASQGRDFADKAKEKSQELQRCMKDEMGKYLKNQL